MAYRCVRCQYQGDDADAHAAEAGHPRCTVCSRSLQLAEQQTCTACIGRTRADLADVGDLWQRLPAELGAMGSTGLEPIGRSDEQPLPGGDALALLGPGSDGSAAGGLPHAGDAWPSDPPSVAAVLSSWADDWKAIRGERA